MRPIVGLNGLTGIILISLIPVLAGCASGTSATPGAGPPTPPISEVSWSEAVELIRTGEVWQVAQTHSLEVTLYLEDGRTARAIEPRIDEVFRVVEQCGDPCGDMILMTE